MNEPQSSQNELPTNVVVDNALLMELTRALLPYLGSDSISTVKRASQTSHDIHALIRTVSDQVANASQRAQFVKAAYRILKGNQTEPVKVVPGKPREATPITPEYVHRGQDALAQVIGPLASVLAQRYATTCDNSRDFFEKLASHLRSDEEREAFFLCVRSAGGMVAVDRKR